MKDVAKLGVLKTPSLKDFGRVEANFCQELPMLV